MHGALIVVGVIPVVVALATGARLGTEATLGGLLVLVGLVGGCRSR